MKKILMILTLSIIATPSFAMSDIQLSELIGYTILGTKTITGWYSEDGKKGDGFEGCEYNRVIVFDNNKILTCRNYNYHYSYRPKATILSNGVSYKMIVDDTIYDMSRY